MEFSGINDYEAPTKALLQLQGNESRTKAFVLLIEKVSIMFTIEQTSGIDESPFASTASRFAVNGR